MHSGQVLNGRYELLEPVGKGGMGEVWKARDLQLRRYVAIKGIRDAATQGLNVKRRLEREAENHAPLSHDRIVPMIDAFIEDEHLYLVMRFIEGTDLRTACNSGALSEADKVAILADVLEGMTYLHERTTVVHRDLKPANILLGENNRAYIADFGIALSRLDPDATQTQGIVGTPGFVAPEVVGQKTATQASDVWSFGAIALWVFTGHTPELHTPEMGIPEGNFAGSLTDDIRAALSSRRPPASELLQSFRRAEREGMTVAVPVVSSPTPPAPTAPESSYAAAVAQKRRRRVLVALIFVALAAIAVLAMAVLRPLTAHPEASGTSPAPISASPTPAETSTPSEAPTPSETPTPTISTPSSTPTPDEVTLVPHTSAAALSGDIIDGRIEISSSRGKLAPGLYDVRQPPGYEPYVYTAAGRLGRTGCYAQWKVVNNGKLLDTTRTPCEKPGSSSEVYWPNLIKYEVGTVEVTADITTDWGAARMLKITFQMSEN